MTDQSIYEDDYLFDTRGAKGLDAIVKSLPQVTTRGSTMIVDGRVKFKAPPRITCPRCDGELRLASTTLVFKHAPSESREQPVEAWVCQCGESYIPGQGARDAYMRAMHRESDRSSVASKSTHSATELKGNYGLSEAAIALLRCAASDPERRVIRYEEGGTTQIYTAFELFDDVRNAEQEHVSNEALDALVDKGLLQRTEDVDQSDREVFVLTESARALSETLTRS